MGREEDFLFREEQRFRQPWLWAFLVVLSALSFYAFFLKACLIRQTGLAEGPPEILYPIWILCGVGIPVLFLLATLITGVGEDGVYIKFHPFHLSFRKHTWDEIESFEAVTYNPLKDYGGWGIRYRKDGMAYNVCGNRGVILKLKDGKTIMIGSRKPEEMVAAMRDMIRA